MPRRIKDLDVQVDDIGGPITLGDLRWLVDECDALDDSSTVDVKAPRIGMNQFDRDPAVIKVRGKLWPK